MPVVAAVEQFDEFSTYRIRSMQRAGFWRRLLAFVIDLIVAFIVFQLIIAVFHKYWDGHVSSTGLSMACNRIQNLPDGFPVDSVQWANKAQECRSTVFNIETAHFVDLQREIPRGARRYYELNSAGRVIDGVYLATEYSFLLLWPYMIFIEWKFSATFGKIVTGVRVIGLGETDGRSIQLWRATVRQLAKLLGIMPIIFYKVVLPSPQALEMGPMRVALGMLAVGCLIFVWSWIIWNVWCAASKMDSPYDWLAGTAVVKS